MTNRVLMNSGVLKVSKPGVNVITAGPQDLAFSSDFSMFGFYRQGTLSYNWSGGNLGEYSNNVPLGKTFATPPLVFFQLSLGDGRYATLGNTSGFSFEKENYASEFPCYMACWAVVTTTHIQFRGRYNRPDEEDHLSRSFSVRYSIYEYNL